MDIRSYIFFNRLSVKKMAEALEITPAYLSLLKTERARPSRRLARDIFRYTNGEIPMHYLMSLPQYNNQRKDEAHHV